MSPRLPSVRKVVPVLAALALLGVARAEPPDRPEADATRLNERYVIEPGAEALLGEMLGNEQTLPGGCTFRNGQIQRTSVLATYTCGGAETVLELTHPDVAPGAAVRTQRFAVTVKSGTPPAGFVDAVADRIRAREATFQWKSVGGTAPGSVEIALWSALIGGAALVALLWMWVLRRRAARRRRAA
jgi:hypothetical protein